MPQVTIGLAVTREGIPVRCWVLLPANQHDSQSVDEVQKDKNNWNLGHVVWVMDRGMSSEQNQRLLQSGYGQQILGEKPSGDHLNMVLPSV